MLFYMNRSLRNKRSLERIRITNGSPVEILLRIEKKVSRIFIILNTPIRTNPMMRRFNIFRSIIHIHNTNTWMRPKIHCSIDKDTCKTSTRRHTDNNSTIIREGYR